MYFHIITIIFILLKSFTIGPVAMWSWWLVFLPSIISLSVGALIIAVLLIIALVSTNT